MRAPSLLAASLVGAMALGACSTPAAPDAPAVPDAAAPAPTAPPAASDAGGSLRFALGSDPASIDPRFLADEAGALVVDALFDSLVALDDELDVVPAAAESFEMRDGGRELVFTLRDGATFHDGTAVTAESFVRSFNRIADGTAQPRSFVAHLLEPVVGFHAAQTDGEPLRGVEAVDERTLRIRLRHPFPAFAEVLAHPSLAPMPTDAGDVAGFADEPVGNGPFAMAAPWQHDRFIRVARAEHHDPARLDEVVFQIYPDDASSQRQYEELQEGLVHVAEVPATALDEATALLGASVDGYTGPGVLDGATGAIYYYGFNTARPPFSDPRVRRALSLLIDRQAIAQRLLLGSRRPADAIVPPPIAGHEGGVCGACRFDPQAATALIDEAGGTAIFDGPIRLLHNSGETHEAIARRVARDVEAALDVEVEVVGQDLQPFVETLREGDVGLFRLGWQATFPSMGSYLYPMFHASNLGGDNLTRYDDAEVNELLDRARATTDRQQRINRFQRAERAILTDMPIAPVLFYRHTRAIRPEVKGLRIGALGRADLADAWIDADA